MCRYYTNFQTTIFFSILPNCIDFQLYNCFSVIQRKYLPNFPKKKISNIQNQNLLSTSSLSSSIFHEYPKNLSIGSSSSNSSMTLNSKLVTPYGSICLFFIRLFTFTEDMISFEYIGKVIIPVNFSSRCRRSDLYNLFLDTAPSSPKYPIRRTVFSIMLDECTRIL